MPLDPWTIEKVSDCVRDLCGVELGSDKAYLIEARLQPLATELGCPGLPELLDMVANNTNDARIKLVDAITTNETSFFRDPAAFNAFKYKALPELIDAKQQSAFPNRLRLWSAACSTGQEPYSLLFAIQEVVGDLDAWDIQILATDVSDGAVATASRGVFSSADLSRGLPASVQDRYFDRHPDGFVVKDEYRSRIQFRKMNLLEDFGPVGHFDFIFCRNVAIYFSSEVRCRLFQRLKRHLVGFGYLFAGSMELLSDIGPEFEPQSHCGSTFYRPNLVPAVC